MYKFRKLILVLVVINLSLGGSSSENGDSGETSKLIGESSSGSGPSGTGGTGSDTGGGSGGGTTTTHNNNSAEDDEEEEPSFIGLFSGLLETLTETKESKDCPGQCVHTFRALICEATLENSSCPGNMKCCVEHSTNETESNHHPPPQQYRPPPPPPHWNNNRPNWHYNYQPNYNGPPYPPPHGQPPPQRMPPPQPPNSEIPQQNQNHNQQPQQQQSASQPQPVWQNQVTPSTNWQGSNSNPPFIVMPTDDAPAKVNTIIPEVTSKPVAVVSPNQNLDNLGKNDEIVKDIEDDEDEELTPLVVTKSTASHQESTTESIKPSLQCPGVCVAQRMTIYCDGVYNSNNICSNDLKCCITQEYYMNNYRTNPNLVLIKANETTEISTIQDDELEEAADVVFASNPPPPPPVQQQPQPQPPPLPPAVTTIKSKSKLNYCPGTCVNPLLTFFCNKINHNYYCENDNACCMNETQNEGQQPVLLQQHNEDQGQNGPQQHLRPQEDNCPRVCLPNNLYTKCPKVLRFSCIEGYFCCVSPPYNAYPINPATGQPIYPPGPQGPPSMQHHGPPPPSRPMKPIPPPPPQYMRNNSIMNEKNTFSSTTMRIEDEVYDDEVGSSGPESDEVGSGTLNEKLQINCPGSCINTILSFTCFRNAEITDIFLCNKANTKCCAPKTAIKEYLDSINVTTTTQATVQADKVMKNQISNKSPSGGQIMNHYNPQPTIAPPQIMQHNPQQNMYSPQGPPNMILSQQPNIISHQQIPLPPPPSIPQLQSPPQNSIPIGQSNYQPLPQPQQPNPPNVPLPMQPPNQNQPLVILPQVKPQMNIYNKNPNFNKYVCGVKGNANTESAGAGGILGGQGHTTVGNSRVKRVVGGEDSEPGEWCWQIALINNLNQYLCGGALIGTQWVLTAAHCVTNIIRSGDTIYVRVGDYDLTSKYGSPGAQTLRVQTTYIHHNHNSQTLDNDIALLKLQGQINLKEGVCLVCLPARSGSNNELYNSNKRCTVTGYGYMGESGPIPLRIREANLPIVPETECIRKINAVTEKIFVLPTSSFCAGGELRNDACQGDGGGPLVCLDNGFYELTGLVSWGFGCGRENVPGVYVKVSSFIGWINQIISVNN